MTLPIVILRYHGSKARIAPWIIGHFPPHRLYVEAFAGGAAVLLHKAPSQVEIYNDLDERVVNFFRMLRDNPSTLAQLIDATPYARQEAIAARVASEHTLEDARRTAVVSWMLCGGGQGQWHTGFRVQRPDDASTTVKLWNLLPFRIMLAARRMKQVHIECLPAEELISRYDGPDTLFYLDPPYLPSTRSKWRKTAYRCEMTEAQHIELAEQLHAIQGMAIISGYPSALYTQLYADWHERHTEARTDRGVTKTESIWISPRALRRDLFS